MKKDTVIFDLDGTLALIEHRRKFIQGKRKNWDRFFGECDKDEPNIPIIRINNLFYDAGYKIIILSGRSKIVEDMTIKWLKRYEIKYHTLLMREENDYSPDDVLKYKWLTSFDNNKILCVFDDRDKVVKMWRDNEISCLQVAEGDF